MLSVPEIRDQLIIDFAVIDEEEIDETTIDLYVAEAIVEHNPAYSEDGSDLPSREVPLVKLLAGVKLSLLRASKWATKNSLTNNQGYGNDRDTPFAKLTKQAKVLQEEYNAKCIRMGISPGGTDTGSNTIVQGQLSVVESEGEYRAPYRNDRTVLKSPVLALLEAAAQTTATLKWTKNTDPTFAYYIVFFMPGANAAIFDEVNVDSTTGVPRINDLASKLWTQYEPDYNSLKVTGLTANSPYTFIVAAMNAQMKWVYSNALTVTTAP